MKQAAQLVLDWHSYLVKTRYRSIDWNRKNIVPHLCLFNTKSNTHLQVGTHYQNANVNTVYKDLDIIFLIY